MTLYEIADELRKAAEAVRIDEETGEVIGFEELDEAQAAFDDKIEACAVFYKDMLGDVAKFKSEEAMLKERREKLERKAESFKDYIDRCLSGVGKTEFKTARASVTYRKSSSVQILDETMIPKEYMTEKVSYTPNKTAIKEAIIDGVIVDGAAIVEKQNIQIK